MKTSKYFRLVECNIFFVSLISLIYIYKYKYILEEKKEERQIIAYELKQMECVSEHVQFENDERCEIIFLFSCSNSFPCRIEFFYEFFVS